VAGTQVRSWNVNSATEGCAADDASASLFFAQESKGVWKVGAEPGASTPGSLIAKVGDSSGLEADVEGIAVYHGPGNANYLMVSSQGSDDFKVYDLLAPHDYVDAFTIDGVTAASGIEVTNANLGPSFPNGIFAAQNESSSRMSVEVCSLKGLQFGMSSSDPSTSTTFDAPRPVLLESAVPGADAAASRPELTSYPNPFTAFTQIRYRLPSAQRVELDVLDVAGRVVATLASGVQDAGVHEVSWAGRSKSGQRLPTGLYLVRIRLGPETITHKVVVSQ